MTHDSRRVLSASLKTRQIDASDDMPMAFATRADLRAGAQCVEQTGLVVVGDLTWIAFCPVQCALVGLHCDEKNHRRSRAVPQLRDVNTRTREGMRIPVNPHDREERLGLRLARRVEGTQS